MCLCTWAATILYRISGHLILVTMHEHFNLQKLNLLKILAYIILALSLFIFLLSLSPALPSFTMTPEPVSVLTGENITLECVAIGLPTPVVQWIRLNKTDSTNTTVSTNGNLVINNSSLTDTGDYVCIATNIVGINTVQVPITVMDPTGMCMCQCVRIHVHFVCCVCNSFGSNGYFCFILSQYGHLAAKPYYR